MKKDALNFSYYYESNGERDQGAWMVKDCFERCIYIILKYLYRLPDLYSLFFNDFTFYLSQTPDSPIKDLGVLDLNQFLYTFVSMRHFTFNGRKAVLKLEEMLDQGEILIVQTVIEWMPFWFNYQPEFVPKNYRPGHAFIIIGHDQKYYYYLEFKDYIDPSRFVPSKYNTEVGMLAKREVNQRLESFLHFYSIRLHEAKLGKVDGQFLSVIHSAIQYKAPAKVDGGYESYGGDAISKLIGICDAEKTFLNDKVLTLNNVIDLQELFRWKISGETINRRKLLHSCLLLYFKKHNIPIHGQLSIIITELIQKWETVSTVLERRYVKEQYLLDAKIGDHFRKILQLEEQLIAVLTGIFQ